MPALLIEQFDVNAMAIQEQGRIAQNFLSSIAPFDKSEYEVLSYGVSYFRFPN